MKRTTEERKKKEERERRDEREKRTPFSPSILAVWRFEMYPCVGSKRFRVYRQKRAHVEHARVLPVHTEEF